MDKYIIVTTLCDNKVIADRIVDTLLNKRLVAGSHVSKIHSKYWWNNQLEECEEFKLQFRSKESLFKEIRNEIKSIHDYDVAEISCCEIIDASAEILNWIDENVKTDNR